MANGFRAIPDTLRQIAATSFDNTFQAVGTPLIYPSPLVKFINNTSVLVIVSWDGVTFHDVMPSETFTIYDFCSDAGTTAGWYAPEGTQFYVNGSVGTGSFYIVVFYTSEQ